MTKQLIIWLTSIFVLLFVASVWLNPSQGIVESADMRPSGGPSVTPTVTLTPTGYIGERTVSGVVYANSDTPGNELEGALVTCDHFSYVGTGECTPESMITESNGTFFFDLGSVRDTDQMTISAQMAGFVSDTFQFNGVYCLGACPNVSLVLLEQPTATPTITSTPCPVLTLTPESLSVEPVLSPTDELTQTIVTYIGYGKTVTVTGESGIFAITGDFNGSSTPAEVDIDLLAETIHHLRVEARVEPQRGDCLYGSYTLSTLFDRFGDPLTIVQESGGGTPTPTPTPDGGFGERTVSGVVYGGSAEPGNELADATVTCEHTSSNGTQSCDPESFITGADGVFTFDLGVVGFKDQIVIQAERAGYTTAGFNFKGVACFIECPNVSLVLPEQPTATPTFTSTPCPIPTPEPLWVEPVLSPTDALTQTVVVYIGHGEAVTVTGESGVFAVTGDFDAFSTPAEVDIDLLAETTHHLTVRAQVAEIQQGDCLYGGYTLSTTVDRFGDPLTIVQEAGGPTPTPTPDGGFGERTVSGVVYGESAEPGNELADAVVTCEHTSSNGTQSCDPESFITGADGAFIFDLGVVGIKDQIALQAEGMGYVSTSFTFDGLSCFIKTCPPVDLVMVPLPTPTPTATNTATNTPTPTNTPTNTPTPTPTPTLCPIPTPQPLWVEPVISPTDALTQTITVLIGSGEAVTVTAESGIFAVTGDFDATDNPAEVEIDLLPDTIHNLIVEGRVGATGQGGCTYDSYVLMTEVDRFGEPLLIEQVPAEWKLYLPVIIKE